MQYNIRHTFVPYYDFNEYQTGECSLNSDATWPLVICYLNECILYSFS